MKSKVVRTERPPAGALTIPLNASHPPHPDQVGAKAARLWEMRRYGMPVPEGSIVTVAAFEAFCAHNRIRVQADQYQLQERSRQIMEGTFPITLEDLIKGEVRRAGKKAFAVRSSSVSEDGAAHSMAGQFDTFLNVPPDQVLDKIKACWAGACSDAVVAYASKTDQSMNGSMGVVIQEQIEPLYAGVLFTIDPLTKSTDHLIIEWVEGMGDALVSGRVTPQRVMVHRRSFAPAWHLPPGIGDHLKELIDWALAAERRFHCPLDIEWCIDSQGLHLLQARPVTAMTDARSVIWTNVNMAENFPHPLSPFAWSIIDKFYTYYMRNILRLFGWSDEQLEKAKSFVHNLTGIHHGRIYYNLSNWYEILHFFPIGKQLKSYLDNYIGQSVPLTYRPDPANQWITRVWRNPLKHIAFWSRLTYLHLSARHHLNRFERQFHRHRQGWRREPYDRLALDSLIRRIDDLFTGFVDKYYYSQGIADISVLLFPGLLNQIIKRWFPEYTDRPEAATMQLFQGLEIKSTEPVRIITRLARSIKKNPLQQQFLEEKDEGRLEAELDGVQKDLLDRFMHEYGARCYNECMIVAPTFDERHDLFWNLVRKYQLTSGIGVDASRTGERHKQNVFRNKLAGRLNPLRRTIFKWILRNAYRAIALREQGRLIRSLLFGEIRALILSVGRHLQTMGHLEQREDVFQLQLEEIDQLVYGKFQFPETIGALIRQRAAAAEKAQNVEPPQLFLAERGRYHRPSAATENSATDQSRVTGTGVSAGSVVAMARVILDPVADNRLQPGEILVTRSTDPGWTPLFIIAGGLILEKGGLLSHGAIVAREFSIPAVVGIENATRMIKDGDRVRIDGHSGEIEIMRECV